MGALFVLLNALAYIILFVVGWRKRREIDIYILIVLLYALTAIMCFLYYRIEYNTYPGISLIPFVYLYFVLMLFLKPVRQLHINRIENTFTNNSFLKILILVFICFAFYDIITSFTHTQEIIQNGAYNELRDQGYVDEDSVELYSNSYQRMAKNICSYLSPFAIVYFFSMLSSKKPQKLLMSFVMISIVVPSFIAAVADASRGMIVSLIFQLLIGYLLFRNAIPNKRKKYIYLGSVAILAVFLSYTIAVTVSRFGDESNDSLFMYFGHSMLSFNDGIYYSVTQYSCGSKFFDWFVSLFGIESFFPHAAGVKHPGSFITFIGSLYIDFGAVGTVCVALLAQLIVKRFFLKRNIKLSDCIIIIFYSTTLANGIFVSSRNRALMWIMTFVVYYIVKLGERYSNNKIELYG